VSSKGSSRAPGGWNNGVSHTNNVLQARANVKNNKYKDVYGLVAFAPAIVGMLGQIHADFLRLLWVLADKQLRSYYESMGKEDKIGTEARCERCLLITESPKTPGHYRYLIWVLVYIPYTGLAVFSFAISRFPVYTAISISCKFVFSTLQSRSCWQLSNFCLLRGLKG